MSCAGITYYPRNKFSKKNFGKNVQERGKIRGMKNKLTILTAQENNKSQTSKMKMDRKEKNHNNMAEKTKKTWNFLPGNR